MMRKYTFSMTDFYRADEVDTELGASHDALEAMAEKGVKKDQRIAELEATVMEWRERGIEAEKREMTIRAEADRLEAERVPDDVLEDLFNSIDRSIATELADPLRHVVAGIAAIRQKNRESNNV